jgi:hypothetical protein
MVKNQSGSILSDGSVVKAVGTLGLSGRIVIDLMTGDTPSEYLMGILTQTLNHGDDGYVTAFGKIRGIDTTGSSVGEVWSDGTILYVHPTISGALTNTEPPVNKCKTVVAIVIKANANGTILTRPTFTHRLREVVDVESYTSTDLLAGQYLSWSTSGTSGYWKVTTPPIGSSGTSGSSGSSGNSGSSGASGSSGTSGSNGSSGTSGSSGTTGSNGTSGTSVSSSTLLIWNIL